MSQKKRLEKIIDICKLNKDSNEEWIRQLTFLITNLGKVATNMEQRKKMLVKETAELVRLGQVLKQQQLQKKEEMGDLAKEIEFNMEMQFRLDDAVMVNYSEEVERNQKEDLQLSLEKLTSQRQLKLEMPKVAANKQDKASEKNYQNLFEELKTDFKKLASFLEVSEEELSKSKGNINYFSKYQSRPFL